MLRSFGVDLMSIEPEMKYAKEDGQSVRIE